jgi:hypothetical protein
MRSGRCSYSRSPRQGTGRPRRPSPHCIDEGRHRRGLRATCRRAVPPRCSTRGPWFRRCRPLRSMRLLDRYWQRSRIPTRGCRSRRRLRRGYGPVPPCPRRGRWRRPSTPIMPRRWVLVDSRRTVAAVRQRHPCPIVGAHSALLEALAVHERDDRLLSQHIAHRASHPRSHSSENGDPADPSERRASGRCNSRGSELRRTGYAQSSDPA